MEALRAPLAAAGFLVVVACGDNLAPVEAEPDPCDVEVRSFELEPGRHFPPGTALTWSSNPPATGSHYGIWARWGRTYPEPVPRGHWVHNLEHGGVVLLHRCPDGCPDDVAAIEAVVAELPVDPLCAPARPTRTLITPDPELPPDIRIAAAAWGWTYTATCVDATSLRAFIDEHYADAPENTCAEGGYPASVAAP